MGGSLHGLHGGVHGSELSRPHWTALFELYERVWPGMPGRLRLAEHLGARWADCTTPFTLFEHGRAIATVGVLAHPVRLSGEDVLVGGIHSVGTDPDFRWRGHCRRVLAEAVRWAEQRHALLKLSTGVPRVFKEHGFSAQPTHTFAVEIATAPRPDLALRALDLATATDRELVRRELARRAPISNVFATRDEGWITLIDAALASVTQSWFFEAPAIDAVLVAERAGARCTVHDVIAARVPTLEQLVAAVAPCEQLVLTFCPDLLDGDFSARATPDDEVLMVRGDWPELPLFGVPPLWEH